MLNFDIFKIFLLLRKVNDCQTINTHFFKILKLKKPLPGLIKRNYLRDKELKRQRIYCGNGTNPACAILGVRVHVAVVHVHVPRVRGFSIHCLGLSRFITGGMPNR